MIAERSALLTFIFLLQYCQFARDSFSPFVSTAKFRALVRSQTKRYPAEPVNFVFIAKLVPRVRRHHMLFI